MACEVVWAEVSAAFPDRRSAYAAMQRLEVSFSANNSMSVVEAGAEWRAYRGGGGSRNRIVPDFIVASHAMLLADRLLTRDRVFYRSQFCRLQVVDPTSD